MSAISAIFNNGGTESRSSKKGYLWISKKEKIQKNLKVLLKALIFMD